jgi:hypothetical protein
MRVAHVGGRLGLDQVACEADALVGEPHHDVAGGVAPAEVAQLDPPIPQVEAEGLAECLGRPRQAGNRLGALEEPRHAALLGCPVGQATLLDERRRLLVGDDPPRPEGAGTQGAHGVVVGQHQVAEGQVGERPHHVDPLARHDRRGPRLDGQHALVANDAADVRVALRGEGIDPLGKALEGRFLDGEIRARGEGLGTHRCRF